MIFENGLRNRSIYAKKRLVMNKKALLTTASFILSTAIAHADVSMREDYNFEIGPITTPKTYIMENMKSQPQLSLQPLDEKKTDSLPASLIVAFAEFAYSVDNNQGWDTGDKEIYNMLINDGWQLDPFIGTTGAADNQVESVSGLLAFKDNHVVIATRGTEMDNWNDWLTNFRFSRSPIGRIFPSEANKISAITAQFFGVDGEIANGFLQTHLSSWDYIQKAIMKYAVSSGKSTKDLRYTITGHSMGAAKAQLNALRLLTDSTLGIGVSEVEKSFMDDYYEDLGMSGFYGMAQKSAPKNPGNVETIVFESPRVFSDITAEHVNRIMGENLFRVENGNQVFADPVIFLPPESLGFKHAGQAIEINNGFLMLRKHLMKNVGEAAIPALEASRGDRGG